MNKDFDSFLRDMKRVRELVPRAYATMKVFRLMEKASRIQMIYVLTHVLVMYLKLSAKLSKIPEKEFLRHYRGVFMEIYNELGIDIEYEKGN